MSQQAPIIDLKPFLSKNRQSILSDSGRTIAVYPDGDEEYLEVIEPSGQLSLKIRLTEDGPVMVLEGARLELKSAESVTLAAKRISINAEEEASVESKGSLKIASSDDMKIHSEEDVVVTGKILHLN
ncbi:MAG: hypothetical protein HC887_10860 [Desulfobacteraceae bacterium]|nr:hypothetical protein [Desulfobacteraceae bacterium]